MKKIVVLCGFLLVGALSACSSTPDPMPESMPSSQEMKAEGMDKMEETGQDIADKTASEMDNVGDGVDAIGGAEAVLEAKSGSTLTGKAIFAKAQDGKITLTIGIAGVQPGMHAAHIHAVGDCSSDDGKSAGGHWNPTTMDHGKWGGDHFHLGDIGNIQAGEDGKGSITLSSDKWAIGGGGDNDVVGKAIIVHIKADDFTSQPSGAAGTRIGCGVIKAQ
jgi:Cu-Zn family superoxide dismutase